MCAKKIKGVVWGSVTTTARKMLVFRHPTPKFPRRGSPGGRARRTYWGIPGDYSTVVRQNVAVAIAKLLRKMARSVHILEAKKMASVPISEAKKVTAKKAVLRVRVQLRKDGEGS